MRAIKRWVNRLVFRWTSTTLPDGTLLVWGGEVFDSKLLKQREGGAVKLLSSGLASGQM